MGKEKILTIYPTKKGDAYISLFDKNTGKLEYEIETETKTETYKFVNILKNDHSMDIKIIKLRPPYDFSVFKRYDLSSWDDASRINHSVKNTLCRFLTILSPNSSVEASPLLLLGTLLSGYTSEIFEKKISNKELPIRALTLDVAWRSGVTNLFQKAISALAPKLYPYSLEDCVENIHFRMPQDFIPKSDTNSPDELAFFSPQWPCPKDELGQSSFTALAEPVIGDDKYSLEYRNIAVLIQAAHGFKLIEVEDFLANNPFCAAIVIRRPRQKLCVECKLETSEKEFSHFDLLHPIWDVMESMVKHFLSAIFDKKGKSLPWKVFWQRAKRHVVHYQIANREFSTAQSHSYCILGATLLAFLKHFEDFQMLTSDACEELYSTWMNILLPGSADVDSQYETAQHLSPVIQDSGTNHFFESDQAFINFLKKVYLSDNGIHILKMEKGSTNQWYETSTPDGQHKIYGYVTLITPSNKGCPCRCVVFRKKDLLPLLENFLVETNYVIQNPARLLREVKKTEWGKQNILSQKNGIYKKRMPQNDRDSATVDAVAIKCDGLPFMQPKDESKTKFDKNFRSFYVTQDETFDDFDNLF